jgi:5-methylthioadenosine/S-adenosylhomocysteine deaminase
MHIPKLGDIGTPPRLKQRTVFKSVRALDAGLQFDGKRNYDIYVQDGKVFDIVSAGSGKPDGDWSECNGDGFMAMPPLWNAHTHCALNFFRGLGHEAPGNAEASMIEQVLFPAEKNLSPELVEPLSYAHIIEGLRSGVGYFADHYYYVTGVGRALERFGLKGYIGETVADLGGAKPGRDAWDRARNDMERWNFSSRIKPVVAPHAADTVSRPLLTELAKFARSQKIPLHMHLAQTEGEASRVRTRENLSPVELAYQCEALFERTLAVHMVEVNDQDLARIQETKATIGHCPVSQVIYHKLAPIELFRKKGIEIALGTDCGASNDSGNMMQEMKFAAILSRDRGSIMTAKETLAAATTAPAKVFAGNAGLGLLKKGNPADLNFIKLDFEFFPEHDLHAHFVFSAQQHNVRHQMIDGEWTMWNQTPTQPDLEELSIAYRDSCREILSRCGMRI